MTREERKECKFFLALTGWLGLTVALMGWNFFYRTSWKVQLILSVAYVAISLLLMLPAVGKSKHNRIIISFCILVCILSIQTVNFANYWNSVQLQREYEERLAERQEHVIRSVYL